MFELKYDYLVCAMGCKTNTFGTPGVAEREGKDDEAREEDIGRSECPLYLSLLLGCFGGRPPPQVPAMSLAFTASKT
eukprot:scaffold141517_cov35-Tisochrysis_lutea.AAC.2